MAFRRLVKIERKSDQVQEVEVAQRKQRSKRMKRGNRDSAFVY